MLESVLGSRLSSCNTALMGAPGSSTGQVTCLFLSFSTVRVWWLSFQPFFIEGLLSTLLAGWHMNYDESAALRALGEECYCFHFVGQEAWAQSGEVTVPRSRSSVGMALEFRACSGQPPVLLLSPCSCPSKVPLWGASRFACLSSGRPCYPEGKGYSFTHWSVSVYLGGWRLAVSEPQAVESLFVAKAVGSGCLSGEGSVFFLGWGGRRSSGTWLDSIQLNSASLWLGRSLDPVIQDDLWQPAQQL